jgi:hypothetical protein
MIAAMKLPRILSAVLLTLSLGGLAVACGDAEQGEACDVIGKGDGECEDGLICARETGGAVVCLRQCKDSAECGTDRECNGIEGTSAKACRLKIK